MAHADPIAPDDIARIVMLAFGPMEQGGEYWCYVAVRPGRYEEFKRAMAGKRYNIQHFEQDGYGEIIVSGDGGLPPRDVTKQVAQLFNIPIRQLFEDIDPQAAIAKGIEALKNADTAN